MLGVDSHEDEKVYIALPKPIIKTWEDIING